MRTALNTHQSGKLLTAMIVIDETIQRGVPKGNEWKKLNLQSHTEQQSAAKRQHSPQQYSENFFCIRIYRSFYSILRAIFIIITGIRQVYNSITRYPSRLRGVIPDAPTSTRFSGWMRMYI
jgi:hypothetical protein